MNEKTEEFDIFETSCFTTNLAIERLKLPHTEEEKEAMIVMLQVNFRLFESMIRELRKK